MYRQTLYCTTKVFLIKKLTTKQCQLQVKKGQSLLPFFIISGNQVLQHTYYNHRSHQYE